MSASSAAASAANLGYNNPSVEMDDLSELEKLLVEHYRLESAQADGNTLAHPGIWKRVGRIGKGTYGTVFREERFQAGRNEVRAVKRIDKGDFYLSKELVALTHLSARRYENFFGHFRGWYDDEEYIYLVSDFFEKGDLAKQLADRNAPLTERATCDIVRQVLSGLCIMHRHNFSHRDLKPANIFVLQGDPAWKIRIGDFGLSKRTNEDTMLRSKVGTPLYWAPEVAGLLPRHQRQSAGHYSFAVDIWGLGIVAYELLTAQRPFSESSDVRDYCDGSIPFPNGPLQSHHISLETTELIRSLLSVNPIDRPTAEQAFTLWQRRYETLPAGSISRPGPPKRYQFVESDDSDSDKATVRPKSSHVEILGAQEPTVSLEPTKERFQEHERVDSSRRERQNPTFAEAAKASSTRGRPPSIRNSAAGVSSFAGKSTPRNRVPDNNRANKMDNYTTVSAMDSREVADHEIKKRNHRALLLEQKRFHYRCMEGEFVPGVSSKKYQEASRRAEKGRSAAIDLIRATPRTWTTKLRTSGSVKSVVGCLLRIRSGEVIIETESKEDVALDISDLIEEDFEIIKETLGVANTPTDPKAWNLLPELGKLTQIDPNPIGPDKKQKSLDPDNLFSRFFRDDKVDLSAWPQPSDRDKRQKNRHPDDIFEQFFQDDKVDLPAWPQPIDPDKYRHPEDIFEQFFRAEKPDLYRPNPVKEQKSARTREENPQKAIPDDPNSIAPDEDEVNTMTREDIFTQFYGPRDEFHKYLTGEEDDPRAHLHQKTHHYPRKPAHPPARALYH